jgi:hypothetical protein
MNLRRFPSYPSISKCSTIVSTSLLLSALFNLQVCVPIASSTIPLRIKRWIEIRSVSGTVRHLANNRSERAQPGQRLSQVGDGIETGARSSATLAIDEGIGTLQVSENSRFTIQQIEAQNGGYQTQLSVARGQVRLKLRRLNSPASRIEIFTPAGVTGVRGTDFGVSILPSGKTGIATLDGKVAAAAQGKSVDIDRGFQSSVIPGRVPKDPSPLKDNPNLDIQIVNADSNGQIRIIGQTDDINVISLGEQTIEPDEQGMVDFQVPLQADRSVQLTVTTPLGKQKIYRFTMP